MPGKTKVDAEYDLDCVPNILLASVFVAIEIQPADARFMILGWAGDGSLMRLNVQGSQERLELPFVHRHIAVKSLEPIQSLAIVTLGYKPLKGEPFMPPMARIGRR